MAIEKDALDGAKAEARAEVDSERMSPDMLKKRLDETRDATKRDILKKYGFESEAAMDRRLKAMKDIEEAQLSEQEKLKKRLEELEPAAKRAEELEARYAKQIAKQVEALPDNLKKIVSERADGPEEIEALLEMFAEMGVLKSDATATPNAATTGPAHAAPKQAAASTKYTEWQELTKRSQTLGDLFYQNHVHEIERDRPAQ